MCSDNIESLSGKGVCAYNLRRITVIVVALLISSGYQLFSQDLDNEKVRGVYTDIGVSGVFHHKAYFVYNFGHSTFTNTRIDYLREVCYLLTVGWYDYFKKYAIGVGFGINGLNEYNAVALPLTIEGRYFVSSNENSPYVLAQLSSVFPVRGIGGFSMIDADRMALYKFDGLHRGFTANLSMGYKVKFFKYLSSYFQIGYDIKRYSYSQYSFFKSDRKLSLDGVSLSVGLFIF